MPTMMTQTCECRDRMPGFRQWWRTDGSPYPSQGTMGPRVNVGIKKLVVGKQGLTVLSYTCDWCGTELGQLCLGTDGGQPGLPGVL